MTVNRRGIRSAATALARSVLGGGEVPAPLQLRTATITVINKSVTPWTVTLSMSGTLIPGVTILGWADPYVGDRVQVLQQGELLFVLGVPAPGRIYNPATPVPAPPTRPPGEMNPTPPGPALVQSGTVSANNSATLIWPSSWRPGPLHQGGATVKQRAYWFYGNDLQALRGSRTVVSGEIFIRRMDYAGAELANVRLGTHALTAQPVSGVVLSNVETAGQLRRSEGKFFQLSAAMIAGINAGTVRGFGLEPGSDGLNNPDYLIAEEYGPGKEWSGSVTLTIQG